MCFLKRKRGLIKKAIELSKLTDAKVYLTVISEDDMTATSYHSTEQNLYEQAQKVKTLEIFGPELDFEIIKACTKSEANHTIGAKHIKLLAEEGLVHIKYDREAKEGAREIFHFHKTMADRELLSNVKPPEFLTRGFELGKRQAYGMPAIAPPEFMRRP
jgi:hypothetical protein